MENPRRSPSSFASTTPKSAIYLRFNPERKFGKRRTQPCSWYEFDPSKLQSKDRALTFLSDSLPKNQAASTSVIWGSFIYVIGGWIGDHNCEVYYLDTCCLGNGWRRGPPLICPRAEVSTAVYKGKIYAIGGAKDKEEDDYDDSRPTKRRRTKHSDKVILGEVLNPLLNEWEPVVGPNVKQRKELGSMVLEHGTGFMLNLFYEGPFWYDFERSSWSKPNCVKERTYSYGEEQFAKVDNMLYYFHDGLMGYDLEKQRLYSKVKGLDAKMVSPRVYKDDRGHTFRSKAYVVNVGDGRLCLVWQSKLGVHCTKFTVCLHCDGNGEAELVAAVEVLKIYSYGGDGTLDECLSSVQ